MTWVKLDDQFADHPKVLEAGPLATVLFVRSLCYSARFLTDGMIPEGAVPSLLVDLGPGLPEALVRVGLWEKAHGGFMVHDYLVYQPSKVEVLEERERWKQIHSAGGRARAASARRVAGRFAPKDQQDHQQEDRQLRDQQEPHQQDSSGAAGCSAGPAAPAGTPARTPAGSQRVGMGKGKGNASKGKEVTILEMAEQLQGTHEADWWYFEQEFERRGARAPEIEQAKKIARSNGRPILADPPCPACKGERRWRSSSGPWTCSTCHPPPDPDLVAEWVPAEKEARG